MTRIRLVLSAAVLILTAPFAPAQSWTWIGIAGNNDWNTARNWSPQTVPNSPTAAVNFNNVNVGNVNISSSVQVGTVTLDGYGAAGFSTAGFNITSSPGQTLTTTAINLPNTSGGDYGTQTINLASNTNGNLLFPAGSSLTITNNNSGSDYGYYPGLFIGPNTVIGSLGGTGGVVVQGTGVTQITGSFAGGGNVVRGGLTQMGPGTTVFSGDGTFLQGGLTLVGGTLELDYSSNPASKLEAGGLTLNGGYLSILAAATPVTQYVNGTTLGAGHTFMYSDTTSGSTITLNLGAITRAPGATVDIGNASWFTAQTSTGNTNGLLGGGPAYATYGNGSTWATNAGGTIQGLPDASYSANYVPGTNTDFSGGFSSLTSNTTTNSLRFNINVSGQTNLVQLVGANLTLQSGGILMTANSAPTQISGNFGTEMLIAPAEMIIHQYCYNPLMISAGISAPGGLTITGFGSVILGGNNAGLIGPINVNEAPLTITTPAAVSSASAINLNGGLDSNPTLIAQFGNGVNGTVSTNIRLGGNRNYANFISSSSLNSTLTLNGTISSVPGIQSDSGIGRGQDISTGVNLTGNNTFTGNVFLYGGSLGISQDASLGNAANILVLFVGSATGGGLVFLNALNPSITLAHQVYLYGGTPTRIVANGAFVDTISGTISDPGTAGGRLYKAGTGTLLLTGANSYSGGTEIDAGTLSVGADANLGAASGSVIISPGGTLGISSSFSTARALLTGPSAVVGSTGPSNINVAAGQTLTLSGSIADNAGAGTLSLTGSGTVVLNPGQFNYNTYSGGTVVQNGTLQVTMDSALGAGPVTVNALGTLTYAGSDTTARTFTLNSGTLSVAAGQTLTLNGASVGGGFIHGPGTVVVTGGTSLVGVTTSVNAVINPTGPGSYSNFTNAGFLTIAAGVAGPITFSSFTNQGSGSITVGAASAINVTDFQTYGLLTINTAAAPSVTQLTNIGATPLYFNGGSRTFIGTPATAGSFVAGIDLHGQNAVVAGGLFVNNGYVVDLTNGGAVVVADYGSLVKGAGFYQNSPLTQNGGRVQAGNSPGAASFGQLTFGPGGVSNYVFAIDDATGTAGPTPNASGQVSGWGLMKSVQRLVGGATTSGDFAWTADATNKLNFAIETLVNPTTVGTDVTGLMADFDPSRSYSWPAVEWSGNYSGPTDVASLDAATIFDTNGFENPIVGTFGWSLDASGQKLSLTYTPSAVPEPGTLALTGMAAVGWVAFWRRRWQSNDPTATLSA